MGWCSASSHPPSPTTVSSAMISAPTSHDLREDGSTRRIRRQGPTEREARAALNEAIAGLRRGTHVEAGRQSVGEYLDKWLAGKTALCSSTRLSYTQSINLHLRPGIGHLRQADLRHTDIETLYAAMRRLGQPIEGRASPMLAGLLEACRVDAMVRPLSDARIRRRVHATLMSALNSAVKRRLIGSNPAQYVELPTGRRPRAVVWTDEQVRAWRRTGQVPRVAVWTAAQTGLFLDAAEQDRLYPLGIPVDLPDRVVHVDERQALHGLGTGQQSRRPGPPSPPADGREPG